MTKKLLAAGSVLALSLLLASCSGGAQPNDNDTTTAPTSSSSSEPGVATGEPSPGKPDATAPNGDEATVKAAILKVQKDVEVDAESNITGPLAESLAKVEAAFPDEDPFLSEFIKTLDIKIDENSVKIDKEAGTATLSGTSTPDPDSEPYPIVYNFAYENGLWKLSDIVVTDEKNQPSPLSGVLETLTGVATK